MSASSQAEHTGSAEPFVTIKDAAVRLGLPYFKLQRFVAKGHVPTYTISNSRKLVRLSEVVAIIERSRQGGAND